VNAALDKVTEEAILPDKINKNSVKKCEEKTSTKIDRLQG
jgi:hypothetical protein